MLKTYFFLSIAIFCEVAGTMLLPVSQNFTKVVPTVCLAIFYLTSFYLMTFVVTQLSLCDTQSSEIAIFCSDIKIGYHFSTINHVTNLCNSMM